MNSLALPLEILPVDDGRTVVNKFLYFEDIDDTRVVLLHGILMFHYQRDDRDTEAFVRIVDSIMGLRALAARGHPLEFEFSPFFGQFAHQNPPGNPRPSPGRLPPLRLSSAAWSLVFLRFPRCPGQTVPGDGPDDAAFPLSPVLHVVSVLYAAGGARAPKGASAAFSTWRSN